MFFFFFFFCIFTVKRPTGFFSLASSLMVDDSFHHLPPLIETFHNFMLAKVGDQHITY